MKSRRSVTVPIGKLFHGGAALSWVSSFAFSHHDSRWACLLTVQLSSWLFNNYWNISELGRCSFNLRREFDSRGGHVWRQPFLSDYGMHLRIVLQIGLFCTEKIEKLTM